MCRTQCTKKTETYHKPSNWKLEVYLRISIWPALLRKEQNGRHLLIIPYEIPPSSVAPLCLHWVRTTSLSFVTDWLVWGVGVAGGDEIGQRAEAGPGSTVYGMRNQWKSMQGWGRKRRPQLCMGWATRGYKTEKSRVDYLCMGRLKADSGEQNIYTILIIFVSGSEQTCVWPKVEKVDFRQQFDLRQLSKVSEEQFKRNLLFTSSDHFPA